MRRLVELGAVAATGKTFTADLDLVLSSNLLVQANSGFANGLSTLRVLGLVRGPKGGDLEIADVFKE